MQSDQQPNSGSGFSTPAQFRSKLGAYLTGTVIGFLILGSIYYQKHLMTQRIQANADAEAQAQSDAQGDAQGEPASTGTEDQP